MLFPLKQLTSTRWERRSQLHSAIKQIKMLSVTLALSATRDEETRYFSDVLKACTICSVTHYGIHDTNLSNRLAFNEFNIFLA